ncbi:hypothetical protein JHN49_46060, partial [Streptomyces sp. MBT57]|nr:hypothetical protein [Streptomyces sp. MBT57]
HAPDAPHADRPVPASGDRDGVPHSGPGAVPDEQPWGAVPQGPDAPPPGARPAPDDRSWGGNGQTAHTTGNAAVPSAHQPLPAEEPMPGGNPDSTQGRAFSVRTLGQGVPFAQHLAQ